MAFDEWDDNAKSIKKETKSYIDSTIGYYKLWGLKVVAKSTKFLFKFIVTMFCFLMLLFFASMAGAMAIGNLIESQVVGFLIVTGFYLIITILILFTKNRFLDKIILKKLSSIFFEK